ncbi:MAG: malate synthase A [Candidatus Lambdaproteobacteria bacterium]|nr:malate synthase A [Candidatus Lambdaproteobacteria bacterium]
MAHSRSRDLVQLGSGVQIPKAGHTPQSQQVLTPEAVALVADLQRTFGARRKALLAQRQERQAAYDQGQAPEYLDRRSEAATGSWKVAPIPQDLLCRRVEITGPVNSAKMVINMLSRTEDGARADAAMVDFEDSLKPSWSNIVQGMINLRAAAANTLTHVEPARAGRPEKVYRLDPADMAVLMVRPRGLHLAEVNLLVDGEPSAGALVDLGLSFFHTAKELLRQGKTPAYYIPKCEHHLEARWWNDAFTHMERTLGLPVGTLRATFLIETLPAAFQMEEILYETRDHALGLNVGRWDKIFSDIKTLRRHKDRVLADRAAITMSQPWMKAYALRCVKICHARGAFGMGGMAAFTPGQTPEIRKQQTEKVLADKKLEAEWGHDGCWVSHPYFIGVAMEAFTRRNQLDVLHEDSDKYPDLLPRPIGPKTMAGLRTNVRVGIGYTNGWNQDIGCVAWDNLMEDLATLEISRAQTWQWLHNRVRLDDGTPVTEALVRQVFGEELEKILADVRAAMKGAPPAEVQQVLDGFRKAAADAERAFIQPELQDFFRLASEPVEGS